MSNYLSYGQKQEDINLVKQQPKNEEGKVDLNQSMQDYSRLSETFTLEVKNILTDMDKEEEKFISFDQLCGNRMVLNLSSVNEELKNIKQEGFPNGGKRNHDLNENKDLEAIVLNEMSTDANPASQIIQILGGLNIEQSITNTPPLLKKLLEEQKRDPENPIPILLLRSLIWCQRQYQIQKDMEVNLNDLALKSNKLRERLKGEMEIKKQYEEQKIRKNEEINKQILSGMISLNTEIAEVRKMKESKMDQEENDISEEAIQKVKYRLKNDPEMVKAGEMNVIKDKISKMETDLLNTVDNKNLNKEIQEMKKEMKERDNTISKNREDLEKTMESRLKSLESKNKIEGKNIDEKVKEIKDTADQNMNQILGIIAANNDILTWKEKVNLEIEGIKKQKEEDKEQLKKEIGKVKEEMKKLIEEKIKTAKEEMNNTKQELKLYKEEQEEKEKQRNEEKGKKNREEEKKRNEEKKEKEIKDKEWKKELNDVKTEITELIEEEIKKVTNEIKKDKPKSARTKVNKEKEVIDEETWEEWKKERNKEDNKMKVWKEQIEKRLNKEETRLDEIKKKEEEKEEKREEKQKEKKKKEKEEQEEKEENKKRIIKLEKDIKEIKEENNITKTQREGKEKENDLVAEIMKTLPDEGKVKDLIKEEMNSIPKKEEVKKWIKEVYGDSKIKQIDDRLSDLEELWYKEEEIPQDMNKVIKEIKKNIKPGKEQEKANKKRGRPKKEDKKDEKGKKEDEETESDKEVEKRIEVLEQVVGENSLWNKKDGPVDMIGQIKKKLDEVEKSIQNQENYATKKEMEKNLQVIREENGIEYAKIKNIEERINKQDKKKEEEKRKKEEKDQEGKEGNRQEEDSIKKEIQENKENYMKLEQRVSVQESSMKEVLKRQNKVEEENGKIKEKHSILESTSKRNEELLSFVDSKIEQLLLKGKESQSTNILEVSTQLKTEVEKVKEVIEKGKKEEEEKGNIEENLDKLWKEKFGGFEIRYDNQNLDEDIWNKLTKEDKKLFNDKRIEIKRRFIKDAKEKNQLSKALAIWDYYKYKGRKKERKEVNQDEEINKEFEKIQNEKGKEIGERNGYKSKRYNKTRGGKRKGNGKRYGKKRWHQKRRYRKGRPYYKEEEYEREGNSRRYRRGKPNFYNARGDYPRA